MSVLLCPRTGAPCQLTGCMGCHTLPQPFTAPNMGWQCPKCGRGNAPFVLTCPCGPSSPWCQWTTNLGANSGE